MGALALGTRRWLSVGFSAPPHALELAASGMVGRRKVRACS